MSITVLNKNKKCFLKKTNPKTTATKEIIKKKNTFKSLCTIFLLCINSTASINCFIMILFKKKTNTLHKFKTIIKQYTHTSTNYFTNCAPTLCVSLTGSPPE